MNTQGAFAKVAEYPVLALQSAVLCWKALKLVGPAGNSGAIRC